MIDGVELAEALAQICYCGFLRDAKSNGLPAPELCIHCKTFDELKNFLTERRKQGEDFNFSDRIRKGLMGELNDDNKRL